MTFEIREGDCLDRLHEMPDESVQCVVTSPPYWGLRDYGVEGQIGLEPTPEVFVEKMVAVVRELLSIGRGRIVREIEKKRARLWVVGK